MTKSKSSTGQQAINEQPKPLTLVWWDIETVYKKRYPENAKQHDIPGIRASILKHGFRDPLGYDATLGGYVEGNGRAEALYTLFKEGSKVPDGVVVNGDGEDRTWYVPVLLGNDAKSVAEALAYLLDHNNLTLGPAFLSQDTLRLYSNRIYTQLAAMPKEVMPVTFNNDVIAKLVAARSDSDNSDPLGKKGKEVKGGEDQENGNKQPSGEQPAPPPSHVRVVQLFLTTETLPEFETMVAHLATVFSTPNATDTILTALRRIYRPNDPEVENETGERKFA